MAYHEDRTHGTFGFPMGEYIIGNLKTELHWHHESELVYINSGEVTVSVDGIEEKLSVGDVCYIAGGIIHGIIPTDSVYTCIVFDFEKIVKPALTSGEKYFSMIGEGQIIKSFFTGVPDISDTVSKLSVTLDEKKRGYELRAIGRGLEFFSSVIEGEFYHTPSDAELQNRNRVLKMKSVLRRIHNDYSDPLTLADLASEAAMAPEYFCRIFKATIGRPPIDYLNYYRIQCATELLRMTDDYIVDIALSCGFSDMSYFGKLFKKYIGVTAGEYKKMHRSGKIQ